MKLAELVLELTGTLLQLWVFVAMLRARLQRQFPWFFAFISLSLLSTFALFAVGSNQGLYFRIYWISEACSTFVVFFALLEVFHHVFRRFYEIRWFRALFPAVGILLTAIAVIRTAATPPVQGSTVAAMIFAAEVAVGLLEVGLFFLFFILVRFFKVRWRQHAFGIAMGFGISAAGSLVIYVLRSEFGTKFDPVVRIMPPIAYTIAVFVWLLTFITPQPAGPVPGVTPALTPEEMLAEVRQYTRTVKEILKR
ncbi:MAG TPA: hypothetical protein VLT16_14310 [Candidatus Limnocylindrales bacterium]|nr:hypothetical protein [Candidatus Limnocylindrales bacterium]